MYRSLLRPFLFRMDPEDAHDRGVTLLRMAVPSMSAARVMRLVFGPAGPEPADLLGLHFPSRLGLAAGFDKDALVVNAVFGLGFGFEEVGSVSALPWDGNPRPRVFRFPDEGAIINRMGLPSIGAEAVAARLRRRPPFPVLVNVTKTGDPFITGDAAVSDIRDAVRVLSPRADAIVLNLSCPNTGDGRTFEDPAALEELLKALNTCDAILDTPLLVKVSPDRDAAEMESIAGTALRHGVRGFVATNTTVLREGLGPVDGGHPKGGMSGRPLHDRSLAVVRTLRACAGRDTVVIGCGGVSSRGDFERFREAGADLVEAFTGFIYEGPFFCRKILGL